MALLYNGIDDYTLIADHAALALGDAAPNSGPWSIACWFRRDVMSDAVPRYLFNWGVSGNPSVMVFTYGSGSAEYGKIFVWIRDSLGVGTYLATSPTTDGAWRHLCLAFDGTTFVVYIDAVPRATATVANWGVIDVAGAWNLGQYAAGSNRFAGALAETAKWDRALSSDERTALASGAPAALFPVGLAWSLPMLAGARPEFARLNVTDASSGAVEHPPKYFLPRRPKVLAAPRGVRPRIVFHSPVFRSPVV